MIIIVVITALVASMSLYCKMRKIKSASRVNATSDDFRGEPSTVPSPSFLQGVFACAMNFADSICFLFFKVVGYFPSHSVRNLFYRYVFWMSISKEVVIYYGLEARSPWNIKIGKGTIIGDKAILDARCGIDIGDNVNISTGVWMWTLQHDVNSPVFSSKGTGGKITIENRAWISSRSTLLPACDIAEGVVVAAGAVVTKRIDEPFTIWGGIPAKRIGERNRHLVYEFSGQHRLFI